MAELIVKFFAVSALLTVIPGPNALLVARNALVARGRAIAVAVGTGAGALTWGLAASIGLTALLHESSRLYEAVKLLGAGYLMYLGLAAIWSTLRHRGRPQPQSSPDPPPPEPPSPDPSSAAAASPGSSSAGSPSPNAVPAASADPSSAASPAARTAPVATRRSTVAAFRAGFVSDVLNPKTGVFYAAIVPQLLPDSVPVFGGTLLFAGVDATVTTTWFTVISLLVARVSTLYTPRVLRVAERVTGTVLIALGLRTALERA